jgi:Tfp pilus assembly PilM family ATPase
MKSRLFSSFSQGLSRRTRRCVAVEFDSAQARMITVDTTSGKAKFSAAVAVPMPAEIDIADPQAVGRFLGQNGLRGQTLIMCVPRSQCVLKPLRLPPGIETSELAGMVRFQVEKELPFKRNEAVIDFTIEGRAGAHGGAAPVTPTQADAQPGIDVLVAAVQQSTIDFYQAVAQAAGAKLQRLGLRPYANLSCALGCGIGSADRAVALVHVTSDLTQVDVLGHEALLFSRDCVVKVSSDVDEAATAIVAEASRTLRSMRAVDPEMDVASIFVAGGTGAESRVAALLAEQLSVPASKLDVSRLFEASSAAVDPSSFITVLGLGMGHVAGDGQPFDFLHPKQPTLRRDPRKARAVLAATAAVLAGAIAIGGSTMWLGAKQKQLSTLQSELTKLQQDNKRVAALAKRTKAIDTWQQTARPWLDHWAYLSGLLPGATDVYIAALKTTSDGSITLTVKSRTPESIAALGKRLDNSGYDFKPGPVTAAEDPFGYGFTSDARLGVKGSLKLDLASIKPEPRPENDMTPDEAAASQPSRKRPNNARPRRAG